MVFDDRERDSVLRDLASPDEEVRRLAVERVDVLPPQEAIARLVDALGDSSWRVRKGAVGRLAARSISEDIPHALIEALADGDNGGRRNGAVEALAGCGARSVAPLIEALATEDVDVRKLVVDALAAIGDPRSADPLVVRLRDEDLNVRAAAADALGAIGTGVATVALRRTATSSEEDQIVRFSALCCLATLEAELGTEELASALANPVLRPPALILLGKSEDLAATPVLLKALHDAPRASREAGMRALLSLLSRSDVDEAERLAEAIRASASASPELVTNAVDHLEDADLSTSLMLVQFLGLLGPREAVIPILRAGRDDALAQVSLATLDAMGEVSEEVIDDAWDGLDADLQVASCALLGRRGGPRGNRRLMDALESRAPGLRTAAARSIGRQRFGEAIPILVRRLIIAAIEDPPDGDEEIGAVTEALIAIATPSPDVDHAMCDEVVRQLVDQLEDSHPNIRLSIATILGSIGRSEDALLIAFLLKDPEPSVRRAAVHALVRLEPLSVGEPLRLALGDESSSVRVAAARALGALGREEYIDDLAQAVDDGDPLVRAAVVRSVGSLYPSSQVEGRRAVAREILSCALFDDAAVALPAAETLRELGGADALRTIPLLQRSEPELVLEAVRSIGLHAEPDGLEILFPFVGHECWSVRGEVIQLLASRGIARAIPPILRRLELEQDEFVREMILSALKRLEG